MEPGEAQTSRLNVFSAKVDLYTVCLGVNSTASYNVPLG